ncbi:MAG: hypothetical protein AAF684_12435, partial [Pseudomonadota bacterium]
RSIPAKSCASRRWTDARPMPRLRSAIAAGALLVAGCAGGPPPDDDAPPPLSLRGVQFLGEALNPGFERAFRRRLDEGANAQTEPDRRRPVDLIVTVDALDDASFVAEQLVGADSSAAVRLKLVDPESGETVALREATAEDGGFFLPPGIGLINPIAGLATTGLSLLVNAFSDETAGLAEDLADVAAADVIVPNDVILPRGFAYRIPPAPNPDERPAGVAANAFLGDYPTRVAAERERSIVLRDHPDLSARGWFDVDFERGRFRLWLRGLSVDDERGLCVRRRAQDRPCAITSVE